MQGTQLKEAVFVRSSLQAAQMHGANLSNAHLQNKAFFEAQLEDANFFFAQFLGNLSFNDARLVRAEFTGVNMQGVDLGGMDLSGANLSSAELQTADLSDASLQGAVLYNAQLQGANLYGADLRGAHFDRTRFSEATELTAASFQGAAILSVDRTTLAKLQSHWGDVILFADDLPEHAPAHWVQIEDSFTHDTFIAQWRAWAATLDPPVTIAPDWQP